MILMTQKNRVISGTLFNIWRASERLAVVVVVAVMSPTIGTTTWQLPERSCLAGQPQLEAATALAGYGNDLAVARPRQPPGEREAEAGPAAGARPGREDRLVRVGRQPGAFALDGDRHAAVRGHRRDPHDRARVGDRVVEQ